MDSSTSSLAITAALKSTFGSAPVDVTPLSGGASTASLFRLERGGRAYLLRAEGERSPLRNPHQYISMRIATEAGLAPKLLYLDDANGVVITDFIEQRPLRAYPGGPRALAQALGELLARLQAMPAFPEFVEYPDIVARLFAHVRSAGLFADGLLNAHVEKLARITDRLAWNRAKSVSSHNDINPRNILFDGTRLWLIDWESAYRNDPLVDASILLDNLAPTAELQDVLLRAWLGRAPDGALLSRLPDIRALTRLYFAGVLLSASATVPRKTPDDDLSALGPAEFERAARAGPTLETVHAFGKIYLSAFLSGAPVPPLDSL